MKMSIMIVDANDSYVDDVDDVNGDIPLSIFMSFSSLHTSQSSL